MVPGRNRIMSHTAAGIRPVNISAVNCSFNILRLSVVSKYIGHIITGVVLYSKTEAGALVSCMMGR
jgi:hypothetical protein